MRVSQFEWDDGNALHLALGHGVEPEEAEEVFAISPVYRKTRRGRYAAFGRTRGGRLLVIVFQHKARGLVRVITGWDMTTAERRHYEKSARRRRR